MEFYETKQNLLKLASKLFKYQPKKLTKDVDTEGMFDHIKSDVHGVVSFSPAETMKLQNLNYQRDQQGRDYFSSFLTIAIQAGVWLGFKTKEKEIADLMDRLVSEKELRKSYGESLRSANEKLSINVMSEGELEDEIRKLRTRIQDVENENSRLSRYKDLTHQMLSGLQFDGEIKILKR